MTYHVIKNAEGEFFTGDMKLCHPPLLLFSPEVKAAHVYRTARQAAHQITEAGNPKGLKVETLDSQDLPHLAD